MLDQRTDAPQTDHLNVTANVTRDGHGHGCSREGCGRMATLRVTALFLVWWSCHRHVDDLLGLIAEHGFPIARHD